MKFGNILLVSIPVVLGLLMVSTYDTRTLGFTGYHNDLPFNNATPVKSASSSYADGLAEMLKLYEQITKEENEKFKTDILKKWGDFAESSKDTWVSYVDNGNVRRTVDYENGSIKIELQIPNTAMVPKHVAGKLEKEMYKLLNTTEKEAFHDNKVAQNIEKRLPEDNRFIKRGIPEDRKLFDISRLKAIKFNHTNLRKVSTYGKNIAQTTVSSSKKAGKVVVSSTLQLHTEILQKASRYANSVFVAANKQKIQPWLIFAIMESESSFNPFAKSHIPAYGLMQIVPTTAGLDATRHLYGKAKVLAPSYLYSTANNIKIGAAYLHVLYHKYMAKVKDPQSRIYCVIAAYNTGASNVARAFINRQVFNSAVKRINKMTPEQVYQKLVRRLPYRETRKYVKKVTRNMEKYYTVDISEMAES